MRVDPGELLAVIDGSSRRSEAFGRLLFVPPLRVLPLPSLPDPAAVGVPPLLYLLGDIGELDSGSGLLDWLDCLTAFGGAPVALCLPRRGYDWIAPARHPHCCGLLPADPFPATDDLERVLTAARRYWAGRRLRSTARRSAFAWTFTARQAADPERIWLLIESAMAAALGPGEDLSRLGIAFSEALTNAVEHGSLELNSSLKDDPREGFRRYFHERRRRLESGRFGLRTIFVGARVTDHALRIRIRHRGRGFLFAPVRPESVPTELRRPHGFGLRMIESMVDEMRVSRDGREIFLMRHRRPITARPAVRFSSDPQSGRDRSAA